MDAQNIAVTGYYGTGSSAMLDLLSEYDNVSIVPEIGHTYEHVIFYYPNALFDLCTLLRHGNTPQGSDMAINNFLDSMKRLNKYDFDWFGSYKKLFGNEFMNIVDTFVDNISECKDGSSSYHVIKSRFSPIKFLAQEIMRLIWKRNYATRGNIHVVDKKPMYFSMPTESELFPVVKQFTNEYFSLFKLAERKKYRVFDHVIWPQQIDEQKECFDENFKVIVLARDPRDLFILDKYIWHMPPLGTGKPHFGYDVKHFVEEWKRTFIKSFENSNTCQIYFEDLVYNYDSTSKLIESFLGLSEEQHSLKFTEFDPKKSIENTQVFLCSDEWKEEVDYIAKELSDYLYEFPYERIPRRKNMFDLTNH